MANELSQYIADEKWDKVISLTRLKPDSAKIWSLRLGLFEGVKDSNVLPLHEALVGGAPLEVIAALLEAYPTSIQLKETSYERLPLHCACRKNANAKVVKLLLSRYKEGALIADVLGRLPIHYALSNGAVDAVVEELLRAQPNAARGVDNRGWTPLHVACGVGASTDVVIYLLKSFPEASVVKTNKGSSPLRCLDAQNALNKSEVRAILSKYERQVNERFRPARRCSSQRIIV